MGICNLCSQEANLQCSNCKTAFYCSKSHQKLHWKHHKGDCCCYEIVTSSDLGRHMVAKRCIKAGETILSEFPLVYGPKIASYPICLGCDRLLDENFEKCFKCGWPICSQSCEFLTKHEKECQVMSNNGYYCPISKDDRLKMESSYACITPLRCLLLNKDDFHSLSTLQSHLDQRIDTALYQIYKVNLVIFFRKILNLIQFDESAILNVAAILDTNAFEVKLPQKQMKIRAVYHRAAMLSHHCRPNVKHVVEIDYKLKIVSTVPIDRGEIINLTYTQTLWGTLDRRQHLWNMKCFWCLCDRCTDSTEYRTFIGSYRCSSCDSYVVSENPTDSNANWNCIRCNKCYNSCAVHSFNKDLKEVLKSLVNNSPESSLQKFINDAQQVEKYEFKPHKNHFSIIQAKYAILQLRNLRISDLNTQLLHESIELNNELLEIANILDRGLSKFREQLLLWRESFVKMLK